MLGDVSAGLEGCPEAVCWLFATGVLNAEPDDGWRWTSERSPQSYRTSCAASRCGTAATRRPPSSDAWRCGLATWAEALGIVQDPQGLGRRRL